MTAGQKASIAIFVASFLSIAGAANAAPSFDCTKATTRVENMICDHPRIAELDSELADAYRTALRDAPWASANRRIRAEQKEWLAQRNQCTDVRCLRHVYHRRISELFAEVNGSVPGDEASQSDPEAMTAVCCDRAAHVFHVRVPNVETKYEGQRTDGTHAVNGTAYLRNAEETFQCSFGSDGMSIVRFVVN